MRPLRSGTGLALVALTACQTTGGAHAPLSAADVAAIQALDRHFVACLLAGDLPRLVQGFYAADAELLAPNAPAAKGHAEITAVLGAMPPATKFELLSADVAGCGDFAYARGAYAATFAPPGAAPVPDQGKSLVVYRRQPDGSWRAIRDMFCSDLPAPGAK